MNTIIEEDVKNIINNFDKWDELKKKTVLITGANGFLPAYMVETLIYLSTHSGLEIRVVALVRTYEKACIRFTHILDSPYLNIIQHDVCNELTLDEDIHFIVHAASQASPKYYSVDPVGTLAANTIGTYNLLKFATTKKIEGFLFFSSSEIYGNSPKSEFLDEEMVGESDPATLRACYSESKRMGETMCIAFYHQHNIPITVVRPFHTYGPGLGLDDGRVFADFIANVVKGEDVVMKSDGTAIRSFCYITDATIGFFSILIKGKKGEVYNVGNPYATCSIIELANIIVSLFPEKSVKIISNLNKDDFYLKSTFNKLCPDIDKIKKIGWIPNINIREGFTRTIKSFENE